MGFDITSPANERIKRLIRLRNRRERDAEGVFVVEGLRLFESAKNSGFEPIEVYTDGSTEIPGAHVITVAPPALDRASYRSRADRVIAIFEQFRCDLDSIEAGPDGILLVAEEIEKPGNLGAIVRTADAVGAAGVIAVGGTVDVFNPNTLRSSTGAVFTVPVVTTDLDRLLAWLEIPLVAATPEAGTVLWDADLRGGVALMVGAEDVGLSEPARQAATSLVSIPMAGSSDSLNASVSIAILAYEALRQHRTGDR